MKVHSRHDSINLKTQLTKIDRRLHHWEMEGKFL